MGLNAGTDWHQSGGLARVASILILGTRVMAATPPICVGPRGLDSPQPPGQASGHPSHIIAPWSCHDHYRLYAASKAVLNLFC